MSEIIILNAITKKYSTGFFRKKEIVALSNVNFSINSGEIFSLIGPNGAGKTTLIRVIMNLIPEDSGTVLLFGEKNKNPELKAQIGYVPEQCKIPKDLRVDRFLYYWGRFSGLDGAKIKSKVDELIALLDLSSKYTAKIGELSKGMKAKLILCQAIISEPKLLIMDEPLDGIDPTSRIEIRNVLLSMKSKGVTILINSHLISEVELVSDRIAIIQKGEIVKIDSVQNITATDQRVNILFTLTDGDKLHELRTRYQFETQSEFNFVLTAEDGSLNAVIHDLQSYGAEIKKIEYLKTSLESEFIKVINK